MDTSIGQHDGYYNSNNAPTRSYAVIWTTALAIVGWMVTFVSLCTVASLTHRLSWWIVAFEFCVVIIVCIVIWANMAHVYYPAVLACIAISIPYSTNEVATYLVEGRPAFTAAAAGHIVLIVAEFMWLFLFGTLRHDSTALLHSFDDRNQSSFHSSSSNMMLFRNNMMDVNKTLAVQAVRPYPGSSPAQPGYNFAAPPSSSSPPPPPPPPPLMESGQTQYTLTNDNRDTVFVSPHAKYTIPVVAMHTYDANPEDPNELSFSKGETLHVHEKKGSWWQAKKLNGTVGLIPNNYVISKVHARR